MSDPNVTRTQMPDTEAPSVEPSASGRDANGRFLPDNTAALKHGLRSVRAENGKLIEASAKLVEERDAYQRGDRDALKQTIANSLASTDYLLGGLAPRLALEGVFTTKGRMRAAVSVFIRLSEHKLRLAQALLSLEPSAPRTERSDYLDKLTPEELADVNRILDTARARADQPETEPTTEPPVQHIRIEVPE